MRIGQVARLIADAQTWTTNRITMIGAIDHRCCFEVLVPSSAGAQHAFSWRAGDRVAVSGLRRPDQTIVASLIEKRESGVGTYGGASTQTVGGEYKIGGQSV